MKLSIKLVSLVLTFAVLICGVSLLTFTDGDTEWETADFSGDANPAQDAVKFNYTGIDKTIEFTRGNGGGVADDYIDTFDAPGTEEGNVAPWLANENVDIETVVIGNGITEIGSYSFVNLENLKTLDISKSVTVIKANAFDGSDNIETFKFSGTKDEWLLVEVGENNSILNSTPDEMVKNGVEVWFAGTKYEPQPGGVTTGDVDLDGSVTADDAHLLASYIAGTYDGDPFTADQLTAADVNGDGEYNVIDVVSILKLAA